MYKDYSIAAPQLYISKSRIEQQHNTIYAHTRNAIYTQLYTAHVLRNSNSASTILYMGRIKCSLCRYSFRNLSEIAIIDDDTNIQLDTTHPLHTPLEGLRLYWITFVWEGRFYSRYIMLQCNNCHNET